MVSFDKVNEQYRVYWQTIKDNDIIIFFYQLGKFKLNMSLTVFTQSILNTLNIIADKEYLIEKIFQDNLIVKKYALSKETLFCPLKPRGKTFEMAGFTHKGDIVDISSLHRIQLKRVGTMLALISNEQSTNRRKVLLFDSKSKELIAVEEIKYRQIFFSSCNRYSSQNLVVFQAEKGEDGDFSWNPVSGKVNSKSTDKMLVVTTFYLSFNIKDVLLHMLLFWNPNFCDDLLVDTMELLDMI